MKVQNKGLKQLTDIFFTFFKIGCFTFGGGFAMIPLIEREVVIKKQWVKQEEVIDVFAVSQSIPGAIGINSSTFIGYKIAGYKGAISATLGIILPSFIIITLIAAFFSRFQDYPIVKNAFLGVRASVVALIAMAVIKIGKAAIRDNLTAVIAIVTILLVIVLDVHAIYVIILGSLTGVITYKLFPDRVQKIMKKEGK